MRLDIECYPRGGGSLLFIIALTRKLSCWLPSRGGSHSREMSQTRRLEKQRKKQLSSHLHRAAGPVHSAGPPHQGYCFCLVLRPPPHHARGGRDPLLETHILLPRRSRTDRCLRKLVSEEQLAAVSCGGRRTVPASWAPASRLATPSHLALAPALCLA